MIKFRNGLFTIIDNEEFNLTVERDGKLTLFARGWKPTKPGFKCDFPEIQLWEYSVENENEITNAFSVVTKCSYKGHTFQVENYKENSIRITTGDIKAYEELKLHFVDREWYDLILSPDQVDKIWEERYPSGFRNLPFPKEIEAYKELRK